MEDSTLVELRQLGFRHLLGASTNGLRAELLHAGPPAIGACLRCYNPPEAELSDDELRARLLTDRNVAYTVAAEAGMTVDELRDHFNSARCSEVSAELIGRLRSAVNEPTRLAVSFVSCLAGTFLAAEAVKALSGAPPMGSGANRLGFQFLASNPERNRPILLPRNSNCPMCQPNSVEVRVWGNR